MQQMESTVAALRKAGLGERVLTDRAQLATLGSDALPALHATAAAGAVVESAREAVALVTACHRLGMPFVALHTIQALDRAYETSLKELRP